MIDPLPLPGETLIIEASAGTGKTWELSMLAARFLIETEITVSQMAMVTFSVASATELRTRTLARLHEAADLLSRNTPPGEELSQLWTCDETLRAQRLQRIHVAIEDFDLAVITTTHGFCDRLLSGLGILCDHDRSDKLRPNLSDLWDQEASDHYLRLSMGQQPPFSFHDTQAWKKIALQAPGVPVTPPDTPQATFIESVRSMVDQRKRQAGWYTFDDMLLRCRDALTNPKTGPQARQQLSKLFPVVLVDEFQDTDSIQWEILYSGFVSASTVVLIGDPKQSIYGFRGADVGSYLQATQVGTIKRLHQNFRSRPAVVEAVGNLFKDAELGDARIKVMPVNSSNTTPSLSFSHQVPWEDPVRIRIHKAKEPLSADQARTAINEDLADDLISLLQHSPLYRSHPGAEPRRLEPSDIAILVSRNQRGKEILDTLSHRGIPAVFTGTDPVFLTPAAQSWLIFLRALESETPASLRAASLTDLIGWDLDHLVTANSDEFSQLVSQMRHLRTLLDDHGASSVFEWLCDHTDLEARLGQHSNTFTDLRHLAAMISSMDDRFISPLEWLQTRLASLSSREDTSRRLPTTSGAVAIMTIHQAKGLEFPVVYLPDLADFFTSTTKQPQVIRDESGNRLIDLGLGSSPSSSEEAGESLRTCYVGLTRATTHAVTWWVPTKKNLASSALQRLLFRTTDSPPASVSYTGTDPSSLELPGVTVELMTDIHTCDCPSDPPITLPQNPVHESGGLHQNPRSPVLSRPIDPTWRRTSFSALTASAHEGLPLVSEEPDTNLVEADPELDQLSPMADLPGGVSFGSLVHSIFEYANLADEDLTDVISRTMDATGFTGFTAQDLHSALLPGLLTPLGPLADNVCLAEIPARDQMAEMGFELPLSHTDHGATLDSISALLARYIPSDHPLGAYPQHLASDLDPRALRGYLTGSIDVVLRVNGRYLIVDYKTNRLAPMDVRLTLGHYTSAPMAKAMIDSHYVLQALLYNVALHRFLRFRLQGYDPKLHLGGMVYLFVRGMAGPDTPVRDGTPCGVFGWNPPSQLIEELSDLLSGVRP